MLNDLDLVRAGGQLVVTWSGDADVVTVSVGPTPADADAVAVEVRTPGRVVLPAQDPAARQYVRVESLGDAAVIVAERRLPMTGAANFRDLGGYRGDGGRRVRWGAVYRSDALSCLAEGDARLFSALGIRTVCDLRRDPERHDAPNRLPADHLLQVRHLPIGGLVAHTATMSARVLSGEITDVGVDAMTDVYTDIMELYAESFGAAVACAADEEGLALVIHCTAGKDRTGIVCALLLAALGVADEDILDDYELSTEYYSVPRIAAVRPQLEGAGVDVSRVETFFLAHRDVMAATLARVRETHGSIDGYLTGAAGVPATTLETLRDVLLDG
jgi:protein-tyrosine phosphatase